MTIESCMQLVETMLPNRVSDEVKLRFLGEAEWKVRVELCLHHHTRRGERACCARDLGFISEKPENQKCLGGRREAHAGQCP